MNVFPHFKSSVKQVKYTENKRKGVKTVDLSHAGLILVNEFI